MILTSRVFNSRIAYMRKLKLGLARHFNSMLVDLPSPSSLSFAWNFGSILGLLLCLQLLSGVLLAQHYSANSAFASVDMIMREVHLGWAIRFAHSLGATAFLAAIYAHISRALFFGVEVPRGSVWISGVLIFVASMATAFLGYCLPFGSMSLWGAVVITSLLTAIPYVGGQLTEWLWGGFSVGIPTIQRFYAFHYSLPFLIIALIGLHLALLHAHGSSNPLGLHSGHDMVRFHPLFTAKDFVGFAVTANLIAILLFFYPELLSHPDNFNIADPCVTPPSIQPEIYFLPFYSILRSIPNKLAGVMTMILAILILFTLGVGFTGPRGRRLQSTLYWSFIFNFLLLGWLGTLPAEAPFVGLAQLCTLFYFSYFTLLTLSTRLTRGGQ